MQAHTMFHTDSLSGRIKRLARKDVRFFLVLLCIYSTMQSMAVSGFLSVGISSIENRFGLSSRASGFLVSWFDIVTAISVIAVSYLWQSGHRPRVIGVGILVFGLGCFVFASPHFLVHSYKPSLAGVSGTTDADGQKSCVDPDYGVWWVYGIFLIGLALAGLGTAPLYTLGTTFLYDNGGSSGSVYIGIFYMFCALGPAIGYMLGGIFIGRWVDSSSSLAEALVWKNATQYTPTDDEISAIWAGEWWAGYLLCGATSVVFSPLAFLAPSSYGVQYTKCGSVATEVSEIDADEEEEEDGGAAGDASNLEIPLSTFRLEEGDDEGSDEILFSESGTSDSIRWPATSASAPASAPAPTQSQAQAPANVSVTATVSLRRISDRKDVVALETNAASSSAVRKVEGLFAGLWALLNNDIYLAAQLGAASTGLLVVGCGTFFVKFVELAYRVSATTASIIIGITVVFGVCGGIFCGGILSKSLSRRRLAGVIVTVTVVALCVSTSVFMRCERECQGIQCQALPARQTAYGDANSTLWMCDLEKLCAVKMGEGVYTSCDQDLQVVFYCNTTATLTATAATAADNRKCYSVYFFTAAMAMMMFLIFSTQVPVTLIMLWSVPAEQQGLATGFGSFLYRILGAIPGPLIVGQGFDLACMSWGTRCDGARGSCMSYRPEGVVNGFGIFMLAFILTSAAFFTLMNLLICKHKW